MSDAARNSSEATNLVKTEFNSITAENAMKPDSLLNQYGSQNSADEMPVINTTKLSSYLSYAKTNGLGVRGHVLIWHSQTPTWFFREGYSATGAYVSASVMNARMESYIKQILSYCQTNYPGVVYAWDVVNEATTDGGINGIAQGGAGGLRTDQNDWYQVYKDHSYIAKAFEYARKYAASNVKLYYNDFNCYIKNQTIADLLAPIKAAGNIDGIGMQSHLSISYPSADLFNSTVDFFIQKGYKVSITEFDITCYKSNTDTTITDAEREAQAALYKAIMKKLISVSENVESVTFWGLTDNTSWRNPQEPLLFDADYKPKASYQAVMDALK